MVPIFADHLMFFAAPSWMLHSDGMFLSVMLARFRLKRASLSGPATGADSLRSAGALPCSRIGLVMFVGPDDSAHPRKRNGRQTKIASAINRMRYFPLFSMA